MNKYTDTPRTTGAKMASMNIDASRLYKGTIKPEQMNSSVEFDQTPGKRNPYRYYQLSPEYYDFARNQNRHTPSDQITSPRQTHFSELKPRHYTQTRQGMQQENTLTKPFVTAPVKNTKSNKSCCWSSKKKIHPEKNRSSEMAAPHRQTPRTDTITRVNNDETWLKTPKPVNKYSKGDNVTPQSYNYARNASRAGDEKLLIFPNTLSTRPEIKKPKQRELVLSRPVTTHPPPRDTSPQDQVKNTPQVISPDTVAFNPLYKESPDFLYSHLVPVALDDYVRSVPVKRVSSKNLVEGNPLIPVMVPAERSANNDLFSSRDSPVYSDVYVERDYVHDSFYKRYTNIPNYNAVGFMLSDTDFFSD